MHALPYCVDCKRSYRHLRAHFRTAMHARNVQESEHQSLTQSLECTICMRPTASDRFVKCLRCVHYWCSDCNQQMERCPYCRLTGNIGPTTSNSAARMHRLLLHMDRWRRRLNPDPRSNVLVRLTWNEVGYLTHLSMTATRNT
jgi:hypothetical protein